MPFFIQHFEIETILKCTISIVLCNMVIDIAVQVTMLLADSGRRLSKIHHQRTNQVQTKTIRSRTEVGILIATLETRTITRGIQAMNQQMVALQVSLSTDSRHNCYRRQTKFAKVIFSQVSVCPRGGGESRGCLPHCILGYTPPPPGPEADTTWGRHPPIMHVRIRSTSGRYASHWNTFLFSLYFNLTSSVLTTITAK